MSYKITTGKSLDSVSDQAYTWSHMPLDAQYPSMKTIRFRACRWWQWPRVAWNRVWHRRLYKFWRDGK